MIRLLKLIRSYRGLNLLSGRFFLIPLFFLAGAPLHAEMFPHWDPPTLARHADLVVVGTLSEKSRVAVIQVLKGEPETKNLTIQSLGAFSDVAIFGKRPSVEKLGQKVLLFLDQRTFPPRIVANGFFRVSDEGTYTGVFGYRQEINPGPYVLSPTPAFETLASITDQVKKGCGEIPAIQLAAFEKVKAEIPSNSFHSALAGLCKITRRGDMEILRKVATLDLSFPEMKVGFLSGFLREVQDPAALDLLLELNQRQGNDSMLQAIGSLGNPKALDYFNLLLSKEKGPDAYYVLWGMRDLYLACEDRGALADCQLVRERMYREIDQDLNRLIMMSPQLISVIPHQGSLDRLQEAYDHHVKLDNNAAYDINLHLVACRKKIAAVKLAAVSGADHKR